MKDNFEQESAQIYKEISDSLEKGKQLIKDIKNGNIETNDDIELNALVKQVEIMNAALEHLLKYLTEI